MSAGAGLVGFRAADPDEEPAGGAGAGVAFGGEVVEVQADDLAAAQGGGPAEEEQGAGAAHHGMGLRAAEDGRDGGGEAADVVEGQGDGAALGGAKPAGGPGERGAHQGSAASDGRPVSPNA